MAQTVLVTGSNSGFGRLTVETLARQGYIVLAAMRAINGRNTTAAQELREFAERERAVVHPIEVDITDDASVEQAIPAAVAITGRLDVVFNNAGTSAFGPLEAFSSEQAQSLFATNVLSVLRLNRAAVPFMRQQGSGLLIQVGSIIGRVAVPFLGLYGATKFALEGITESYRRELAPFGIDAAIIEPGTFPTAIARNRQLAADTERLGLYQTAIDAFTTPFFAATRSVTPPNPQDVADGVARLIAMPAGTRPLRVVVATAEQSAAPQALNDANEQAAHSFYTALGLPIEPLACQAPSGER